MLEHTNDLISSRKNQSLVFDYLNDPTAKVHDQPKDLLQIQQEGFAGLGKRLTKYQEEQQIQADKMKYRNYGIRFDTITKRWVGNR